MKMSEQHSAVKLIRDYFGDERKVTMEECKNLSKEDRQQLGSAIAQEQGILQDECKFEFVTY